MTKREILELGKARIFLDMDCADTAARIVSALIRSTLNSKTRAHLLDTADKWNLTNEPEFII
jgi:hypothetical protein